MLRSGLKVFRHDPFFYVVYQEDKIRQLVFFSSHASRFLYGATIKEGLYSDVVWNAAASIASVDVLCPDLFTKWAAGAHDQLEKSRKDQKGREEAKRLGIDALALARAAHKAKGYPGLKKGREAQKRMGIDVLALAHAATIAKGNPGLKKAHEAMRRGDPRAIAFAGIRGEIRAGNAKDKRLAKWRALMQTKEISLLMDIDIPADHLEDPDRLREIFDHHAALNGLTERWDDLSIRQKPWYPKKLARWQAKVAAWRQSENSWIDLSSEVQARDLAELVIWYDAKTDPNGLRYIGDGGPEIPDNPDGFNPSVVLFHRQTVAPASQAKYREEVSARLNQNRATSSD
ncbi:hypothetical protein V8C44DRAFT_166592 [Trichoderma aethiopicum]